MLMLSCVLQPVVCRILQTGCPVDIELVVLHLVSAIHNIPVIVMSLLLRNVVTIVL